MRRCFGGLFLMCGGKGQFCLRTSICQQMRKPGIIIVLTVLVGGLVAAGMTLQVLTLRNNDDIVFIRVVRPGETFRLTYLHSVSLTDVGERFAIAADFELVLTETRFKGQGAGLPTSLSGDETLVREGDWMVITGMHRKIPLLYWRVQTPWQDRFRFNNGPEINVSRTVGDALILIQVQKMKAIVWAYHRLIFEIQNRMKARR